MVDEERLSGRWRGRLIDVQGFEGEILLDLASVDGKLRGQYSVEIGAAHSTLKQGGAVEGAFSDGVVKLAFTAGDPPAKIGLTGDVIELRDGGVGLRGVYEVSARTYSPLQGGIVSAAKDRKFDAEIMTRRDRQ